jgi:general secretion pathway protein B
MSYILDALRRADAERERGSVPDLRAQPLGAASSQEAPRPLPWPWIAAVLAALLFGALAWYLAAPDEPPVVVSTAALSAAPDGATATTPDAATRTLRADAATSAPPRPSATASPAVPAGPPKPSVTVVATAPPRAASVPAKTEPAASAAAGRVYAQAELPPDVRRQLPALAIGGSMYSENAANRMLIVNGQLFHENEKPAPEVTLEKIKLKSAVLRFRDYRFEVSY